MYTECRCRCDRPTGSTGTVVCVQPDYVIVFGAGASYGSGTGAHPWKPFGPAYRSPSPPRCRDGRRGASPGRGGREPARDRRGDQAPAADGPSRSGHRTGPKPIPSAAPRFRQRIDPLSPGGPVTNAYGPPFLDTRGPRLHRGGRTQKRRVISPSAGAWWRLHQCPTPRDRSERGRIFRAAKPVV